MRRRTTALFGLFTLTAIASVVRADAFDPKRVPAEAKWVVHIDADAIRASKLWPMIHQRLDSNYDAQTKIQQLEAITGLKFPDDLHDVTLYGKSFSPDDGVVIIHADADQERIMNLLQMNQAFNSEKHGDHDVVSWDDNGKTTYGSFFDKSLIIMAKSQANVEATLDVLDDKAAKSQPDSVLAPAAGTGILAFIAGQGLSELALAGKPQSPLIHQMDSGSLSLSEKGDGIAVTGTLTAISAASAEKVRQSLEGIKAMVELAGGDDNADPKAKAAAAAVPSLKVQAQDKVLTVDWAVSMDVVQGFLNAVAGPTTRASGDANP